MAKLLINSKRDISQFKTLVLGAGSGGLPMTHRMARYHNARFIVGMVDPAENHYYQPLWTLVGGGMKKFEESLKPILDLNSTETFWYQNMVTEFMPEQNKVKLIDDTVLEYKNLIVALGIDLKWDKVENLDEAIAKKAEGICSNYSAHTVERTWENLQRIATLAKTSNNKIEAIFTQPNTPIKCGGAPQKILYLADDYFRQQNVRDNINMHYFTGMPGIFPQPDYAETMRNLIKQKNINILYENNLTKVDYKNKMATFNKCGEVPYDMIHITPPMGPLNVLKNSSLGNADGWVDVDKHTLQHNKYKNIWSLGDCSSLPTSKTAAAIAAQNIVLYNNLVSYIEDPDKPLPSLYDGYTSCPLVTSRSTCLLAEFDYELKRKETTFLDQRKVNKSFYFMKSEILPIIYWKKHVWGKWEGPEKLRKIMAPLKKN